jgi:AcrR family transcriptional regulator
LSSDLKQTERSDFLDRKIPPIKHRFIFRPRGPMTATRSKAEAARTRIINAMVRRLDAAGYAGASIGQVQLDAGVSRGALTHHFPSKQALTAATARSLLDAALRTVEGRAKATPTAALLAHSWRRVMNTPEGRALLEILMACRTDPALHAALKPDLRDWDARIGAAVEARYVGDGDGDAALLWSICRSFLRGLMLHERYAEGPEDLSRMITRFAAIMEAHLRPR